MEQNTGRSTMNEKRKRRRDGRRKKENIGVIKREEGRRGDRGLLRRR